MTKDKLSTVAMWGKTPGKMFDLFKTEYTYRAKRDEVLSKHPKGKKYIRGFVPDKFVPADGGTFKMFHHQAGGVQKFGQLKLYNCQNIILEDDLLYFEDENNVGKYILVPSTCHFN